MKYSDLLCFASQKTVRFASGIVDDIIVYPYLNVFGTVLFSVFLGFLNKIHITHVG